MQCGAEVVKNLHHVAVRALRLEAALAEALSSGAAELRANTNRQPNFSPVQFCHRSWVHCTVQTITFHFSDNDLPYKRFLKKTNITNKFLVKKPGQIDKFQIKFEKDKLPLELNYQIFLFRLHFTVRWKSFCDPYSVPSSHTCRSFRSDLREFSLNFCGMLSYWIQLGF